MIRFILLLMLWSPAVLLAAIEIQIDNVDGGMTTVLSNGDKARINSANEEGYTLVDYNKQTMYVVMPEQKRIMDVSGNTSAGGQSKARGVRINLDELGNGPTIAGFTTNKYRLTADGKNCGIVFGSREAMRAAGVEKLFRSMQQFAEKQQSMIGGYADMMDSCDRAEMNFAKQAKTIGIPMRTVDKNGVTTSEVKRLNTNASASSAAFELPQGYQMVTMDEQMKQAQQHMKQMEQYAPQMEQMMQQMPPEMREQMKRMQEMMKQQ